MKISLNWLRKYVKLPPTVTELAERLTLAGLEVESITDLAAQYAGFVIARVAGVEKHPAADRLVVCKVETGEAVRQIVCGAPNVAPGQTVIVGLPGAVIPKNQHDPDGQPFTLARATIRGVESNGMICSAYELGIGEDKSGIVVLHEEIAPGTSLASYLNAENTILEIGVTPNRPDALSHFGIAREVGLLWGKPMRFPAAKVKESKEQAKSALSVRIEAREACPRYSARVVRGVRIEPSPRWLALTLEQVGIRPVNNVVDITNYVLMEYGHPLHAFDYDAVEGHTIIVRLSREGERFTTLDHKERPLREDSLLICDGARPIAVAGVMGGENSEISAATTSIVIESAYFDPRSIRRTSKFLGLSTDASQRFERGADPSGTIAALDRAAGLIQEICGGTVLRGVIDVYPRKIAAQKVTVDPCAVNDLLGTTISEKEIYGILQKLSFAPTRKKAAKGKMGVIVCTIPTYRPDISLPVDVTEEIARVHGYDKISDASASTLRLGHNPTVESITEPLREWLIGSGYNEILTNSMQDLETAMLTSGNPVRIANPISRDMAALRTSMIPGALKIIQHNTYHGSNNIRLFEFGKVYSMRDGENPREQDAYSEKEILLLAWSNEAERPAWDKKPRQFDIFDAKGEIESLAEKFSLDNSNFIPYSTTDALTQTGLRIEINGESAGSIGVIAKGLLERFGIDQPVYVAELLVDVLGKHRRQGRKYKALPKFPAVLRDVALVVDEKIEHGALLEAIERSGAKYLQSVRLFDYYVGEQIGKGKKSFAFALEFASEDHTLTQDEVDRSMNQLLGNVSRKLDAHIRQ